MRALFYHSFRDWSGSARVFAEAARALQVRGYSVTYVCPPDSLVEQRVSYAGFEVETIPDDTPLISRSYRLRRLVAEKFVEVVFVHTEEEHLTAATALRFAERGAVVRRTPAGRRLRAGPETRGAMRLATTGFLFTSEGERHSAPPLSRRLEPVVADLGVDVARFDAVQPAVSHTLANAAGGRLVVCLYDPTSRARAANVLRTVALLSPRHPDLRLAFVGRGSDDDDLRMHAAALGITGIVSFLGERDDYLAIIRVATLGWVVADADDAAFAALDLMALRVPVLCERGTVTQRYVADGITGAHLPPGDVPATAASIAWLLAHDEQRAAMGSAGRARVAREFSEAEMAEGFDRAALAARDRSRWIVV